MMRLAVLLARHGGAIYTDLLGLGIDLDDGPVWPRVLDVIDHLGPGSALHRETTPVEWRDWSVTNAQLANIEDHLAAANWQRIGSKTAPRPVPAWRPVDAEKARAREDRWQTRARSFVARLKGR